MTTPVIELNTIQPDPHTALAEADPLDIICANMEERGFGIGQLWSAYGGSALKFTDGLKREYLRHFAVSGRHAFAAASVGLSRSAVSRTRKNDPVFAAACEEAEEYFRDLLKAEMYRRGVTGFKREVVGGKNRNEIIEITDYSDRAMELLARVHIPAMQKQQIEVKGSIDNSTVNVANTMFDPSTMPKEDLAMFKQLLLNQAAREKNAAADADAIEGEVTNVK